MAETRLKATRALVRFVSILGSERPPLIQRQRAFAALVTASVGFFFCSAAFAETATVTIDSRSPALEEVDSGGWTTSLGLTNLTDKTIAITAQPRDTTDTGCNLVLDKNELPGAEHTPVKVTVPAGCKVGEDGIDFTVSAPVESAAPVTFVITAAPKPDESKAEWGALWAFPISLVLLLVAAVLVMALSSEGRPPNKPLKYLPTAWSFKDSWITNITILGGLLAGIFGSSDVVKAFLGEDAESSVALATVGAAVAVAFIGAGPVILFATKSKVGDFFTAGGLIVASAVTLAGAAGEIWVLFESGRKLDLDGLEDWAWVMAAVAFGLLAVYAIRTIPATLHVGLKKPKQPVSDTIVGAKMIVAALKQLPGINTQALDDAVDAVADDYPTVGTSPGDDLPRPVRSALP
jgi:hypothetical protein